ncbi:MAG: hypothetical protein K2K16_10010 [Ruminococcus sp.]|nr:hypothetical protein [Ruminococcus sp.]
MPIEQSSRTIIFEQFSPGVNYVTGKPTDRLDFMLRKNPDDKLLKEIEETLGVSSYEEFLKKFKPVIYEKQVGNPDTGDISFEYSLDMPPAPFFEIDITNQKFYEIANKIYDQKNSSGESNLDFRYDEILEVLTPKKLIREMKNMRRQLEYKINKALEYEEEDPDSDEFAEYADEVEKIRRKIINKYGNGSMSGMIMLAMGDNQTKLDYIERHELQLGMKDSDIVSETKLIPCDTTFDEDGNIKIIPAEITGSSGRDTKRLTSSKQFLLETLTVDIDECADDKIKQSSFARNTILSTFIGLDVNGSTALTELNKEELIIKRDQYNRYYKKMQEGFAEQMIALVEKFLNVRAFFDHAGVKNKNTETKVIIANCNITDLMENEETKSFFRNYLERLGNQSGNEKLWNMIVPALHDSDFLDPGRKKASLRSSLKATMNVNAMETDGLVTFNAFKNFMKMIEEIKIPVFTFFNFKGNEKTSFGSISNNVDIINEFKEKCSKIPEGVKPYSVFCYPNFTVKSRSAGKINFGKVSGDNGDKDISIKFPGIYIDASYVACGMMIASQCNDYLEKTGFNVNKGDAYPPVRFDFEDEFNIKTKTVALRDKIITKMNRESGYSMSDDVVNAIRENGGFGFCFSCEEHTDSDGKTVQNAYVLKARTLSLENKDDGSYYRPIYQSMVKVFLKMMYKINGETNMKNLINKWNTVATKKYINNVLREADSMTMTINNEGGKKVAHIDITYKDISDVYEVVID